MKNIIILFIVFASLTAVAQPAFEYTPSFSAIVVKDVAASSTWYQAVFDLKVKEQMKDEKVGYNIIILESPTFVMELLELKNSFNPKEGKSKDLEAQGLFKFGFTIKDVDACLQHLKKLNITTSKIWTDSKTNKRNFHINDPDGNLIQFFE